MVIVSCSGKFHAFALADQLDKLDLLSDLYTSFASSKNTWAKHFVGRRDQENITLNKIHTNILIATGLKLYQHPPLWNEIFDLWVAQKLRKKGLGYKVFIGWSGMSLHSIRAAKRNGKLTIVERGSSHIQYQDKILREEYAKFGISFQIHSKVLQKELKEYEEADYISIPSTFVKNSFIQYGVPSEKLLLNPYGTSKLFQAKDSVQRDTKFRVLYLGRLSIRKGLIYLFEALSKISKYHDNVEAHFIGSIDAEVQKIIDEFQGIKTNWHFFGHIQQEELPTHISHCDVAVHPSLEEGLSTVIPQILSCGVPVIATTNTGGEDIIKEAETGYIIPIRSPEAIVEKLTYLLEAPQILNKIKLNILNKVHDYSWNNYGLCWHDCIKKLLIESDEQ